jgi:hypothetical protein
VKALTPCSEATRVSRSLHVLLVHSASSSHCQFLLSCHLLEHTVPQNSVM